MSKPEYNEIISLIESFKKVDRELEWKEKPSNSKFLFCSSQIIDDKDQTIEGCLFEGQYKKPIKFLAEKYSFTVFLIRNSIKYRIFQLEIDDWERVTHRDRASNTVVKGPHYHIGDQNHWPESEVIQCEASENQFNFVDWLTQYCKKGNLKLVYSLEHPATQMDLF